MSDLWVDPGRLVDAARVVTVLGERVDSAKPDAAQTETAMSGSRAVAACVAGCRSAVRVLDVVGDGLRRWATTAERSAAAYSRVDEANAGRLVEAGRALPAAGDGR